MSPKVNPLISERAMALKPSPTLALAAKAKELQSQGHSVVNLTVGEPDWETFPAAAQAGILAIQNGHTKYTPAAGLPELRSSLAKKLSQQLRVDVRPSQVVVTSGAKYSLFATFQMLLNPGDEVLIPAPYWVSYPAMVELSGGVSKYILCPEANSFKLKADQLENAISAKSKILILCSPSNPTGIAYNRNELLQIAEVLRRHPQLLIVSDDIYNQLIFSNEELAPHLLHIAPDLVSRVIAINGAAKTYAMTGWRIGWAVGPQEVMTAMADFVSQTTSNVSTISQYAVMTALEQCGPDVLLARNRLKEKMLWFQSEISQMPGLGVIRPDGAFYLWISVQKLLGKKIKPTSGQVEVDVVLKNSKQIAEILLEKYFVATVPGIEFGVEGYLRLSFATSEDQLRQASQRIRSFVSGLVE